MSTLNVSQVYPNRRCVVTDATARSQGWMSFIKFIAVLGICGAQVYFTTSFFNQKGGRRPRNNAGMELNPFGQTVI